MPTWPPWVRSIPRSQKLEEGDPAFWRLLLDRVWPIRHEFAAEAQTHLTIGWESDGQDEREVVDVSPG